MKLVDRAISLLDRVSPPRSVRAHCDIPCGIYDPHAAQVAALTVIRMVQLIEALPKPTDGASKAYGPIISSRNIWRNTPTSMICSGRPQS